jgi:DNA modification methylase
MLEEPRRGRSQARKSSFRGSSGWQAVPGQLLCGDNLPLLQATPDASVDLVYVDPPFGTGAIRRGRHALRYRDARDDPEAFTAWLLPRLEHMRRALRDHGSLFVHLDSRAVHYVKVALDGLFGRDRFVNEIAWCYTVGGKSRRGFGRKHDTILWYARTRDHAFFPDAVRVPRKPGSHMRVARDGGGAPVQEKTDRRTGKVYRYPIAAGKVPEDYWTDIETLNRSAAERTGYPTQKPERLLERIVLATTLPGWTVADWFCGSGTTAVVAHRHGRAFIAADESAAAIAIAAARLAAAGYSMPRSSSAKS